MSKRATNIDFPPLAAPVTRAAPALPAAKPAAPAAPSSPLLALAAELGRAHGELRQQLMDHLGVRDLRITDLEDRCAALEERLASAGEVRQLGEFRTKVRPKAVA